VQSSQCGHEISDEDSFCGQCGSPIVQPRPKGVESQQTLFPLGAVVFAVIAGLGALFAWYQWHQPLAVKSLQAIPPPSAGTHALTAISDSRGFGTTLGLIGLATAASFFVTILLTGLAWRGRIAGACLMVVGAIAIIGAAVPAIIKADRAYSGWGSLEYKVPPGVGEALAAAIIGPVQHAIVTHSLIPALAVLGAGLLAFICATGTVIGTMKIRRSRAANLAS
jgi:hypothetical protein